MEVLSKDKVRLLLTIGFAACAGGKVAHARKLFENLRIAYPEADPVQVGLAFSHIVVDDFETGERLLQEVISRGDEDQDALSLLASGTRSARKGYDLSHAAAELGMVCGGSIVAEFQVR